MNNNQNNADDTGIFQLDNGYWGYRYVIKETDSVKTALSNPKPKVVRKTVTQVYNEYCEFGRAGKAYSTIKKQDSLWNNHIKSKFGKRCR